MIALTLRLLPRLHAAIKEKADANGRTVTEEIRAALVAWTVRR